MKSIHAAAADLTSSLLRVEGNEPVAPLETAVSLAAASIKGRVVNARQEPVSRATVVVLPPGAPPFRADRYAASVTARPVNSSFAVCRRENTDKTTRSRMASQVP